MNANENPSMIAYPGTDPTIIRRIEALDQRIHESPQEILEVFENLGGVVLKASIDYKERNERVPRAVRQPKALLEEYFANRYDLDHEFDPATDKALRADTEHKELIEAAHNKRTVIVKTGVMRTAHRENTEAVPARDAVRLHQFGFYIRRIMEFQQRNGINSKLPSAG